MYLKGRFSENHDTIDGKDIVHAMEYDLSQEVYGVPYYLAAINSAHLNDSATMFRRRYYKNGAHAGFIIYGTDNFNQDDWDVLKNNLNNARGDGNFKNILVRAPNGKKDGLQLLPISEVAAKDEFDSIKKVSAADQLAMHRVPPQLMGVMPEVKGGFGDAEKAAMVFAANELRPIQLLFASLNDHYGMTLFDFIDYKITNEPEVK
ncbi:MAG: phage portal protein [Neisseriaceae bacterium]|nr:phage portal protein [Neisseriaceae bacterium]